MANVPNVVLSGLSMVTVPVIMPQARKEASEQERKNRKEAKRAVMRDRKRMFDAYFNEAETYQKARLNIINMLYDPYGCRCLPGVQNRTGHYQYLVNQSVTVPNPYGDSVADMKVKAATDTYQGAARVYVPMPTHTFRRKVSQGEDATAFLARLEAVKNSFFALGLSFLDGACHCPACVVKRKVSYRDWSNPLHDSKNHADRHIRAWDMDNNPFADNYRYKEAATPRQRYDEDGNPLPRNYRRQPVRWPGAGIGGETFSDPKAKGGAARLVGLEVEHNREISQTHAWADNWRGAQVIGDGSCGREAVTPPLAGENIRKCLTELCKALNDGNAGCDSRCGLHVHVDARDMRWADMLRFLTVYCRIESLLFLIGGQNRYSKPGSGGNGYCFPVAELYGKALRSPDPKGAILAAACIGDRSAADGRKLMKDSPPGKKGNGRYKSINIMPWIAGRAFDRKDTTVEFRLHRGSHNAERIITWAHLCQDIVHWCLNATNDDVNNLPKSSARALCIMSPRNKAWIIKRLLGWRAATTAGKAPIEDDVGNYKPRRIVTMKGGLYLVDSTRCSYKVER